MTSRVGPPRLELLGRIDLAHPTRGQHGRTSSCEHASGAQVATQLSLRPYSVHWEVTLLDIVARDIVYTPDGGNTIFLTEAIQYS